MTQSQQHQRNSSTKLSNSLNIIEYKIKESIFNKNEVLQLHWARKAVKGQ